MMRPSRWLPSWLRKNGSRTQPLRNAAPPTTLGCESLEDRTTPASSITVVPGLAGSGSLDTALINSGGIITVGDGGAAPGTVSTGALASIPAANNISVTAAGPITFNDLASVGGTLALATAAGRVASFTAASGGSIVFNNTANSLTVGGGSLSFSASANLTVAQLTTGGGNLTLNAGTGNVTQLGAATAGTGTVNVTGGNNVTVDALTGGTVNLTSTGGALASAAGTNKVVASTQVSAAAATGINLRTQTPTLQQAVDSVSGNVAVVNTGSLTVAGPVTANGAGVVSVTAPNNGATLTVNGAISSGTGAVTLAGAEGLNLGPSAGVSTGGTGTITLNADSNLSAGGVYNQAAGSSVSSGGGTVSVLGTDVILDGTLSAGSGRAVVQNSVGGRTIDLGTNTAGSLGLTATELNNITAGIVQVGSLTAGAITVSAGINPTGTNTLALFNGGAITGTGSITVTNLRLNSVGPVSLTGTNNVAVIAGSASNGLVFNNQTNPLTVGIVDAIPGLTAANSTIGLTTDVIDIQQTLSAGVGPTAVLTIQPFTTARPITVGLGATGLGVSDAELARITAGTVRLGSVIDTGAITVDGAVSRYPGFNTLDLVTGNTSGAAVGQTAAVSVANLAVQASAGGVVLNNPTNNFDTVAVLGGQDVSLRDANSLAIGLVDGVPGVFGPGNVDVKTGAGLTINQRLQAGGTLGIDATGPVTQAAGAAIVQSVGGLLLLGSGPVTLTNTGNSTPTIAATVANGVNFTSAGALSTGTVTTALGTATGITTTNTPVALTTAAGDLTVETGSGIAAGTAAVALTAGGLDSFVTNKASVVGTSAVLTGDRIDLQPGSTINVGTQPANTVTLRPFTLSQPVVLDNAGGDPTGQLQLTGMELSTITAGVVRIGRIDGTGDLTLQSNVVAPPGWDTLHLISGKDITTTGATVTVTNLAAEAGGSVTLPGNNAVTVVAGKAGGSGGVFTFENNGNFAVGTIDAIAGITDAASTGTGVSLTVLPAAGVLTVNSAISTGGAQVSLEADDMGINAGVSAGAGVVVLAPAPVTTNRMIDLGTNSAGNLGLTDAELDRVTAATLRIGGGSPYQGNIVVTSPITQFGSGYTTLQLSTSSGGAITNTVAGSIAGTNLVLLADAGIGTTAIPLATQVANVAFNNANSGDVVIRNVGGFTVANLVGAASSANTAAGGAVTLSTTGGPIRFAVDATSTGTLTATATETGAAGDDVTVNAGVTVKGGSDVTLRAGDNIVLNTGSVVQSVNGTVSLTAGFGDTGDNLGALVLNGTVSISGGATLALTALQDITLGALLNYPGSNVSLTSTKGSIIDGNDPPAGTPNVFAATLNLTAATGIGSGPGVNNPIEVSVNSLTATNTTSGDIRVVNLANANGSVTGSLTATANNTGGGPVAITAAATAAILTVGLGGVVSNGGGITLTADDMAINNAVNAGAGANSVVTLQPFSPARPIQLGVNSVGSTLGLTDLELDRVTAATAVRIGNTSAQTGNLTVEAPITQGVGYATLSLATAGTISENPGIAVTGSTLNLALRGAAGVNFGVSGNDVVSVAGATTAAGADFTYYDVNGLTVGTVDGVAGVLTNNGDIDVETFGVGGLQVAPNTAINSTGGAVTLITRGLNQAFNLNVGASVASGGGNLLIQADNMTLNGSAVNAGPGQATLKPFTVAPAVTINLGGADAPGVLGLSAAELAIATAAVLQIGDITSGSASGSIVVSAAVATPGAAVLSLQTGGGVTEVGGSIAANNLVIRATNAVVMTGNNDVSGSLAGSVSTGGQGFTYTDVNAVIIGTVDNLAGISTNDAPITVTTINGSLTLTGVPITAKSGSIALLAGGANSLLVNAAAISNLGLNPITLQGDRMQLSAGSVNAQGGGRVTLQAFTAGRLVDLGSTTDLANNTLELSNTELGTVTTTGPLQIGRGTEGTINVSSSVSVGAGGAGTLSLVNNGGVTETGVITAGNLRVTAAGPVTLGGSNQIGGSVAGQLSTSGAAFTFNNAGSVTIGNVDGVTGITTNNGPITVSTSNGNLTATNNITAGTANIALTAGGSENLLRVTPLQAFGGNATLTADRIDLAPNVANLINVGTGTIAIVPFTTGTAPARPVDLGGVGDPTGILTLSDGELDSLFAGLVRIGAGTGAPVTAVAGDITVTAPITQGPGYTTLSLASLGKVTETGAGSLGLSNLAVRATGGVTLGSTTNTVTNVAGMTTGNPFTFTNGNSLLVNSVDGVNGITTAGGAVAVNVTLGNGLLGVQNAIIAGNANVDLTADDMDLQAQVSAGTQTVTLAPANNPRVISLGTNAGGTLSLTDTELDRVVAGVLRVGTLANAGNINVTAQITAPAGYNTLALATAGAITDGTLTEQTDITVANLALQATAGVGDANDLNVAVTNLAATNLASGNLRVSNTGSLVVPAAGVAGVTTGVINGGPGTVALSAAGGSITVNNQVLGSGGGAVSLTTSGTGGAITVSPTGSVRATGGNGTVTLDASNATSGGTVTINNNPASDPDVGATGSGTVTVLANAGVALGVGAKVASGSGTITLQANTNAGVGNANVTLGNNSSVITDGNVVLNADPDSNGVGGTIQFGTGVTIADNLGGPVNQIDVTSATDQVVTSLSADVLVSIKSTGASIRDDGIETTFITAPNISLSASKAIGGTTAITVADTLTRTATYLNAIDFNLQGGALSLAQTGTGGNVQLHRVDGTFATSNLPAGFTPVGANNQLALLGDAGVTVDSPITLAAVGNTNLLLGSAGNGAALPATIGPGNIVVNAAITDSGATAPVALVTAGGAISVGAPVMAGGNVNLTAAGNAVGNGVFLNANVTAVGSGATVTINANRDVRLDNPGAVVATTAANGGAVTINAGADVSATLTTTGAGGVTMANGSVISTAANNSTITINAGKGAGTGDDIVLSAVTAGTGVVNVRAFKGSIADANGPTTTNVSGGAISLQADGSLGIEADVFTATPGSAGVTAATTNDPITLRGQANTPLQIQNVNAGTGDVTLTALNGNLTNRSPGDLAADVTGKTVTLAATGTGTIGLAGPTFFEVDAQFLNAATNNQNLFVADVAGGVAINTVNAGSATATLQSANGAMTSATVDGNPDVVGSTVVLRAPAAGGSFGVSAALPLEIAANNLDANLLGTGSVSVRDTAGGLTVTQAQTANGNVNLEAAGLAANLTLTQVTAGSGGTATARATGAVVGTAGGATDVTAGAFAVLGGTNLGSVAAPLETAVGKLAANVGAGGLFVTQTGALDVNTVAGVNGIRSAGGRVSVVDAGNLSVSQNVTTSADITLNATGAGATLTVNGPAVVNSTANGVSIRADGGLTVAAGATVNATTGLTATVGLGGGSGSTIAGTFSGTNPVILGDIGGDSLVVDYGAGANLPNGLTFVPGGGADVLSVTDASGPAANRAYDIDPTRLVRDGATGSAITFSGTPTLLVTGGPSDDVFNVVPGAVTAVTIVGLTPTPPAAPGDALNVDLSGTTPFLTVSKVATGLQGSYTFTGGVQPVNFSQVETLGSVPFSLSVSNTDGRTTAIPGTAVTYTVTVSNTGSLGVNGVNFTDVFSAALKNVAWSAVFSSGSSGNAFGTGNINEVLTVAGGGSVTYTVTGTIDPAATGNLVSTAGLNTAGISDNNTADDAAVDTDVLTPTADVTATMSANVSNINAGGVITYTIVVTNTGPSTATGVNVADALPSQIASGAFTSTVSGGATGNTATGTGSINDTLTLPPGATVTYTLTATSASGAGGTVKNTVTATVPAGITDPNAANNTATANVDIVPTSGDVAVTFSTANGTVGSNLSYTVTVTNNGPGASNGIVLTNFLPANATLVSATPSQGTVSIISGGTAISVNVGTLASGASANVVVTVITSKPGQRTTSAAISATTPDPVSGNNTANASFTVNPYPAIIVAGAGAGGAPLVQVFDAVSGRLLRGFLAFDAGATGGVSVAQGDINGDGIPEILTGAGDGGSPLINVFDLRTGGLVKTFFAYEPSFRGGVHVAAGDVNGDGKADIIAGAGNGGAPRVVVFDGVNGAMLRSFFAYDPSFRGGVQVSAGDVNNDGIADVVTGAGAGGAPHATVFDGKTGAQIRSFFAYDQAFRGGVQVTAADVNGDGITDIIAGSGVGGAPQVTVFDGNTAQVRGFFAFDQAARGGVNVAVSDVNGDGIPDIVASTGPGSPPMIKAFSGTTQQVLDSFSALDPTFLGGVFVG